MGPRSIDPHHAMELMLLTDPAVNEARVLDLAVDGQDAQWAVAVSFTESACNEKSQSSELIDGLKERLTQRMQSVSEKITIPTNWFLIEDFPMTEDELIDDEKLRILVIGDDSNDVSDVCSEKIPDTPTTLASIDISGYTDTDTPPSSPLPKQLIRKMIQFPHFAHPSITRATILQAAWAMVISQHNNTKEIQFNLASNMPERDSLVPGVSGMATPVTYTVPMQIRLNEQLPISTFLLQVQQNASRPATRQYRNQKKITKRNLQSLESSQMASLLVIPTTRHKNTGAAEAPLAAEQYTRTEGRLMASCDTYAVALQATTLNNHIDMVLAFNAACITEDSAISLIDSYESAVGQLIKRLQAANWLYRVGWK